MSRYLHASAFYIPINERRRDDVTMDVTQEILERLVRLETKLDGFNQHKETAYSAYNKSVQNEKDINEMKDNQKWLWRTVVGAILAGVIAMYLKGKGVY